MLKTRTARLIGLGGIVLLGLVLVGAALGIRSRLGQGDSAGARASCGGSQLVRNDFPAVPNGNNRYNPSIPGMQLVQDGFVADDQGLLHPHRIESTTTDLTKRIDGVTTIVILERDFQDGALQESELFFQAQNSNGAVWLFGEYPEEYDQGQLTGAPDSFVSGVQGAIPGVIMPAHPVTGTPTYSQGRALQVGFADCAAVFQVGQHVCVPVRCYDDVLVTDEFDATDPTSGHQRKFYAPDVGNIKTAPVGGKQREGLALTSSTCLDTSQLTTLRNLALDTDTRSYTVAAKVFAGTPHARATLGSQGCIKR
jgi:hypothetical protein